jgi:aryl-alcohol dehydrogenase-like predicted oxidoreductase
MRRRAFVRGGLAAAGAALLDATGLPGLAAAGPRRTARDRVALGRTGLTVSVLAQGTGTNGWGGSSNQTRTLGERGLADLLVAGVDQGLNLWDLADQYGSHPHARLALRTVPRDRVVVLTKTHASTEAEMRADLDRFRREIGTDRLDIVLLHCMTSADWPRQKAGAMTVLAEAKQKGIVGAHGVSCHDLGALKAAASSEWVDVDLARLNPAGVQMDAAPARVIPVLEEMKRKGKGVIGMKILGAGALRGRVNQALEYALAQEVLDCFTIGVQSRDELEDLLGRMSRAA